MSRNLCEVELAIDHSLPRPAAVVSSIEHKVVADPTTSATQGPDVDAATRMTCDALCSLSNIQPHLMSTSASDLKEFPDKALRRSSNKHCSKQHQLPMFLSKTYHMIDKCDESIACWSEDGLSFIVKTTEQFASSILPKYFKHSNFSSFARQLNFYGFRKLKAEPILTADFDAQTASYVRFYHEKFQKDRPDLLTQIRRATKSDQQSKDEVDSLKSELAKLKETVSTMSTEYDRRFNDMSYEYNRRITALSSDYDKMAALVQQLLVSQGQATNTALAAAVGTPASDMMRSLSQVAAMTLQGSLGTSTLAAAAAASVAAASVSVASSRKRTHSPDDMPSPSSQKRRLL